MIFDFEKPELADPRTRIPAFFKKLESEKRVISKVKRRNYLLYFSCRYGQEVYICKFARESTTAIHKAGEQDIELIGEQNFPFIYVIVDVYRQAMLIQKKTTVFRTMRQAKQTISAFIAISAGLREHEFRVDEITDEREFWRYVEEAQKIYKLDLRLKSPNLFGFHEETSAVLRELRNIINQDELRLELRNAEGLLQLHPVSWLRNALRYITDGGGSWVLRIKLNNLITAIRSETAVKKVILSVDLDKEDRSSVLKALEESSFRRDDQ